MSRLADPLVEKPADDKERNGRRRQPGLVWFAPPPPARAPRDQNLISDTEKMSGGGDGDSLELVSEFRYAAAALVALCIPTNHPRRPGMSYG